MYEPHATVTFPCKGAREALFRVSKGHVGSGHGGAGAVIDGSGERGVARLGLGVQQRNWVQQEKSGRKSRSDELPSGQIPLEDYPPY